MAKMEVAKQPTGLDENVMVGDLPQDFLRVGSSPQSQQIFADQQAAAALQASQAGGFTFLSPNVARLSITVVQAKLNKNYGLMKMDTYCRLRIGHSVFETHTANGGGKNPRWNKMLHCHVPQGVDSIYLEVFDEKAFTTDDRVAWAHITIPEKVFNKESVEDWFHLNGKQGDGKEGMINLVMSQSPASQVAIQQPVVYATGAPQMMVVPGGMPVCYPAQVPVGVAPVAMGQPRPQQQMMTQPIPQQPQQQQQQQQPQRALFTEEDVQQVKDMFPNVEDEVIKSVLEANRGNKDATINSLLSMAS